MKKLISALAIVALVATAVQAQVAGVVDGGKITVSADPAVNAAGLDLISAGGNLVPAADNNAAPFTFLLSNTANQVTYGNLGTTVEIGPGGLELTAGYNGNPEGDLTASWGDGATPVAFPVAAAAAPPVPEPSTGLMAAFAALGLLGFRRRR